MPDASGPLAGIRVVEFAGLGPAPHAALILADHGADVVRVARPDSSASTFDGLNHAEMMTRGKRTVVLDLKSPAALAEALDLVDSADVLIEGLRPGVAERLGIGPETCQARNPRLVYGRMTGWGQDGPLAQRAGHDINYLGLTGVLDAIGRPGERPVMPINLLGDYGGGSMLLVVGILLALVERDRTGRGSVIDAAIVDGVGVVAQQLWELATQGAWSGGRGGNLLDGGAPFYDTYTCRDGRQVAVGALEAQFYVQLIDGLGLADAGLPARGDPANWPELRAAFTTAFLTRTRDEWAETFAGTDACVTAVLTLAEAAEHPHAVARGSFRRVNGRVTPAPAPRLRRAT